MIRRALVVGALLALAACGGSNPDRLPDDLAGAEGTPLSEGYNADAVEPDPEPAPPAPVANDFASQNLNELAEVVVPDETEDQPRQPADFAPSFSCSGRMVQAAQWICEDRDLAALDRTLARTYARALGDADEQRTVALRQTARRFLDYRNACPEPACVAQAYEGRLREIADIIAR